MDDRAAGVRHGSAGALAFYRQDLGFDVMLVHGEPAFYAQVRRDSARLNLRHVNRPAIERSAGPDLLSAMITASRVGALFLEYEARGVRFHQVLDRRPWHAEGEGSFIIVDPDGNLLAFGGVLD